MVVQDAHGASLAKLKLVPVMVDLGQAERQLRLAGAGPQRRLDRGRRRVGRAVGDRVKRRGSTAPVRLAAAARLLCRAPRSRNGQGIEGPLSRRCEGEDHRWQPESVGRCRLGVRLTLHGSIPALTGGADAMIALGIILLIIGFVTSIKILWTLGIVALVVGGVLAIAGRAGHAIGGRKHWF